MLQMPPKRKGRSQEFIDDSDDPEDTGIKVKKSKLKEESKGAGATASEGTDEMIALSTKRFVNVRTFNGTVLVDIREYYDDANGDRKPAKKGISLSLDQWERLKEAIPDVDIKISEMQ